MPHIDWQKLYEAAMLEINPDKLATCIGAAEQAIAQRESLVDTGNAVGAPKFMDINASHTTELERHKLADARSMLKTLSRIASSQGKQAAYEAASQPRQHERLVRLSSPYTILAGQAQQFLPSRCQADRECQVRE